MAELRRRRRSAKKRGRSQRMSRLSGAKWDHLSFCEHCEADVGHRNSVADSVVGYVRAVAS